MQVTGLHPPPNPAAGPAPVHGLRSTAKPNGHRPNGFGRPRHGASLPMVRLVVGATTLRCGRKPWSGPRLPGASSRPVCTSTCFRRSGPTRRQSCCWHLAGTSSTCRCGLWGSWTRAALPAPSAPPSSCAIRATSAQAMNMPKHRHCHAQGHPGPEASLSPEEPGVPKTPGPAAGDT